ncbi:hypothetical protein ACQEU6_38115 [Spirillospora sp. CA-108201]
MTKAATDSSACIDVVGDLDGTLWWEYGEGADRIALCVERRLRAGDCLLGSKGRGKKGTVAISNGDPMTSWPCEKDSLPEGYDYVLKVTAL